MVDATPETPVPIDWALVWTDVAGAALFFLGLLLVTTGAVVLGAGAWAACVGLDRHALLHLRRVAETADEVGRRALQGYVRYRVLTAAVAQIVALLMGLYAVAAGQVAGGLLVWLVVGAGVLTRRALLPLDGQ